MINKDFFRRRTILINKLNNGKITKDELLELAHSSDLIKEYTWEIKNSRRTVNGITKVFRG
jgi:hypothetical protein